MKEEKISPRVIERLTKYLRLLDTMNMDSYISSDHLAERMGFTAAQVRKDLSNFGEFGIRGKGYQIGTLYKDIEKVLGVDTKNSVVIIGAGRLGEAMLSEPEFAEGSFDIIGVFDRDENKIGSEIKGHTVKNVSELEEFIGQNDVNIGIVSVTKDSAQEIVDILVNNGVKGILNFAPTKLECPKSVALHNLDIYSKLQEINFWRQNQR